VPKRYPPLTAEEIEDCLLALGFDHDRSNDHPVLVNDATHCTVPIDRKWQPAPSSLVKHIIHEQAKVSRETFYGATRRTAKKIGLSPKRRR
jgi:hypothetical protein